MIFFNDFSSLYSLPHTLDPQTLALKLCTKPPRPWLMLQLLSLALVAGPHMSAQCLDGFILSVFVDLSGLYHFSFPQKVRSLLFWFCFLRPPLWPLRGCSRETTSWDNLSEDLAPMARNLDVRGWLLHRQAGRIKKFLEKPLTKPLCHFCLKKKTSLPVACHYLANGCQCFGVKMPEAPAPAMCIADAGVLLAPL